MKSQFDKLPTLNQALRKKSINLNWNIMENSAIRGTTKHRAPSEYIEDIADIIFQYDIAITCMLQYFEALEIRVADSYQNLTNSFIISNEVIEQVNEFLIKVRL